MGKLVVGTDHKSAKSVPRTDRPTCVIPRTGQRHHGLFVIIFFAHNALHRGGLSGA